MPHYTLLAFTERRRSRSRSKERRKDGGKFCHVHDMHMAWCMICISWDIPCFIRTPQRMAGIRLLKFLLAPFEEKNRNG